MVKVTRRKREIEKHREREVGKAASKTFDRKESSPTPFLYPRFLLRQHLLGLGDRKTRVQALGASPCAVENSVATVDAHAVVESGLALGGALVTGIGQPAVRLEQDGGAKVLLAVPPV
jgi:hypothetical protein